MSREVVWTRSAVRNFKQAISHIAASDVHAAEPVLGRVEFAATSLGRLPTGRPGRVSGTYEKSVGGTSYIISYAVTEDRVSVLRVIHSSRNWPTDSWPE